MQNFSLPFIYPLGYLCEFSLWCRRNQCFGTCTILLIHLVISLHLNLCELPWSVNIPARIRVRPAVYTPAEVMVRLKGETDATFSRSNSATDFAFTGAGGVVLGRGAGNMFLPCCIHQTTHNETSVRTRGTSTMFCVRNRHQDFCIVGDLDWMVGSLEIQSPGLYGRLHWTNSNHEPVTSGFERQILF